MALSGLENRHGLIALQSSILWTSANVERQGGLNSLYLQSDQYY